MKLLYKKTLVAFMALLVAILLFVSDVNVVEGAVPKHKVDSQFFNPVEWYTDAEKPDYNVAAITGKSGVQYEFVYQNESLEMYADKSTGKFAIRQKAGGAVWYSVPVDIENDDISKGIQKSGFRSQITAQYIYKEDANSQATVQTATSDDECTYNDNIEVKRLENGIYVRYYFETFGFIIPVAYTIEDDGLKATVDVKNIVEGDSCYLLGINLLPSFGAGGLSDRGYIMIPDGSGAISDFNQNLAKNYYESDVYGNNLTYSKEYVRTYTDSVKMPVFGLSKNNQAFVAIITEGDGMSRITAYNGGDSCAYNTVSSTMVYRQSDMANTLYNKSANGTIIRVTSGHYDLDLYSVTYCFLPENNSDYSGMAQRYRKYLTDNNILSNNTQRPSMNVDLYGSVDRKAAFMGISYRKQTTLTTYKQAIEILENLKSFGVDSIDARYIGWGNDGALNKSVPTRVKLLSNLGSKSDFKKLTDYANSEGINLYLDTDFMRFRSSSFGFLKSFSAVRNLMGSISKQYISYDPAIYEYDKMQPYYYLLNPELLNKASGKYLDSYIEKVDNKSISFSKAGHYVYTSMNDSSKTIRSSYPDIVEKILKNSKSKGLNTSVESGNAYTFKYTDKIFSAPAAPSCYDFFTRQICFYQMVLHGHITLTTPSLVQAVSAEDMFLFAVETGSELLYTGIYGQGELLIGTWLTDKYSSTYTYWIKSAAEKYNRYKPLLNKVYNANIVRNSIVEDNVYKTEFSNGVTVIVNYKDTEINYDSHVINGKDFLMLEVDKNA